MKPHKAKARAPANIALIKYWGKRDNRLNLPQGPSLSVTLSSLFTITSVFFDPELKEDRFILNGIVSSPEKVSKFLDLLRQIAGVKWGAVVESHNSFPTAQGLASSASGFAALTLASANALGLKLPFEVVVSLARQGSGSAPRSLISGYVEVIPGTMEDGSDYKVLQVADQHHLEINLIIVVVRGYEKKVSSRDGMERTRLSSPFYQPFISSTYEDIVVLKRAIVGRDFNTMGRVTERSCFRMHGAIMGCDPPLVYFSPTTLRVIDMVRGLREDGCLAYVTIDAGPHVVVLVQKKDADFVAQKLAEIDGVEQVIIDVPGSCATMLS